LGYNGTTFYLDDEVRNHQKHLLFRLLIAVALLCASSCTQTGPGGSSAEEYFQKAFQFIDAGHPREAVDLLNLAIEKNPRYVEAYHNRAVMYIYLKKYREAIADFTKAIELDPSRAAPYAGRGHAREITGNPAEALSDYKMAARLGDKAVGDHLKSKGVSWD
jgi:Tfp pilus assembly protein PilF